MALSLAALQTEIPGISIPDPTKRYKTLADARAQQQESQLRGIQVQNAQQQQAEGAAVHQAFIDSGGELNEAFLKKVAQNAPTLYPHYKQLYDQQAQQGITNAEAARKGQLENFKVLEESPAPEMTASAAQTTTAPIQTSLTDPSQVSQPQTAPTSTGTTQQVPLPVPLQTLPGNPGLGVPEVKNIRLTSPQQRANQLRETARQKLQDEITLNREKQKAELEFNTSNPPKPTEFEATLADFNKNPALTAKYGKGPIAFDKYKQDQRVEAVREGRVAPETPDLNSAVSTTRSGLKYVDRSQFTGKEQNALVDAANKAGIPAVTKETADLLSEIDNARANLDYMTQTIGPKLAKDPTGRLYTAAANTIEKLTQSDPDLAAIGTYRSAAIQAMRAVAGAKGLRINRAEIEQAQENDIPKLTDTLPAAMAKLKNMTQFLDNAEHAHVVKDRSVAAPGTSGIDVNPKTGQYRRKSGSGYEYSDNKGASWHK